MLIVVCETSIDDVLGIPIDEVNPVPFFMSEAVVSRWVRLCHLVTRLLETHGESVANPGFHRRVLLCEHDLRVQRCVVLDHFVVEPATQFTFLEPSLRPYF
jgi:hypothetical protein